MQARHKLMRARYQPLIWTLLIFALSLVLGNRLREHSMAAHKAQSAPTPINLATLFESNAFGTRKKLSEKLSTNVPGEQAESSLARPSLSATLSVSKPENADQICCGQAVKTLNQGGILHVVQDHEMLEDIASKYNVPLQTLISTNAITDTSAIQAGTEILLPE